MNSTPSPFKPEKSVLDEAIRETAPLPSMLPNSRPSDSVISTTRGTPLQNGGCSSYVPTYFARISGETSTSFFLSSDALPTQCSRVLALFSFQMNSIISVSGASSALTVTVHGRAYVGESDSVT